MKKTISPLLSLAFLTGTLAAAQAAGADGAYQIDAVHSSVVFRVTHLGVSHVYGRFNQLSGSFTIDSSDPAKTSIEVTLQTTSIDTGNSKRDQHLRSADFFNANQFPVITFKSTKVAKVQGEEFSVQGDLSLHGVTKSIPVTLKLAGHGDRGPRFGYRAGLAAEFTIQRSDFGMDFMIGENGVGAEVKILLGLEGARR